jgi:deoxyribonucleoside regulator
MGPARKRKTRSPNDYSDIRDIDPERVISAQVAQLYHDSLISSHAKIAELVGIDRRKVLHYLRDARWRHHVVDVVVRHPLGLRKDLAYELQRACARLNPELKQVVVVATPSDPQRTKHEVGRAAAHSLDEIVAEHAKVRGAPDHDLVIAVSWGSTVAEVANAPAARRAEPSVVAVPAHGTTPVSRGPKPSADLLSWQANEVARRLAARYQGTWYPLSAPALISRPGVAEWLERDPLVAPVLEMARHAHIVLVGIGTVDKKAAFYHAGVLTDQHLQHIRGQNGVGDICGRFFREDGTLCDWPLNRHVVGLSLEDLQNMVRAGSVVMGVAGGREKSKALLGAIRTKALTHIVTDAVCCDLVLGALG